MNFNPNFVGPVRVLPPIIHQRVNDVHRFFLTEQPHILEDQTRIFNHHILRHTCCVRPSVCEFNDCHVENCCNIPLGPGCCPRPFTPGFGPGFGQGAMAQGPVGSSSQGRPPFTPNM